MESSIIDNLMDLKDGYGKIKWAISKKNGYYRRYFNSSIEAFEIKR